MTVARRRSLALTTVALLGAAAVAACSGGGAGGSAGSGATHQVPQVAGPGESVTDTEIPQLDVGLSGAVNTLDPTLRSDSGIYVQPLGMEALLRIGPDGELQPWLASEWEQVSDTVYEYTLREGVTFWDGTELTSEDVKYSWEYLAAPESRRANFYSSVQSIDAPDERTVRVTLKQPDASWQYTPAMFYAIVFQKEHAEQNAATFGQPGTLAIGTGPWKFDSLNPTSGMELSAYEDYWGGEPPVERVSVTFFADDNSMALALRAGEIDIAPLVNGPEGFDAAAGGGTVTTVPTCGTALLSLPTQTAPWDDVHVRRAVAYAINREDVVAATQGRASGPLDLLISPILMRPLGSDDEVQAALDEVERYPYDPEAAAAELARSGSPDGFSATIPAYPGAEAATQVIAAQLAELGIDLRIDPVGDTEWFGAVSGPPDQRPLTFSETGACSPDPSWNDIWLGSANLAQGSTNVANWAPADVDQLLAAGLATQDPAERLGIYTNLLHRLSEDVPYVPLYAEGTTYASTTYDIAGYGSFWYSTPWVLNVVPRTDGAS
ncbi:ABC transporter substrate-binding protein [Jiangella endophytica]|uniref:ABC transporter substrate-binding protein n=1 Tax=Jiangella endophytica TaxID=1623398 RepID=UPI000E34CD66|nr:ABC transporter substrate-binding protein [Jiangella endophytica]